MLDRARHIGNLLALAYYTIFNYAFDMLRVKAGDKIHLYVVPATNLLFLFSNRSQKSLEVSIRRSLYEVRTLRGQKSRPCRVFTYATTCQDRA